MASKSEIPSNNEMDGYVVEVKVLKSTIKDCESYIKTLNKKIVIDEAKARGLLMVLNLRSSKWLEAIEPHEVYLGSEMGPHGVFLFLV
ncbi:hypothetical protein PanWU01x14_021480 [Parasponia andersonii]|uniref:Uncharacterized protein n=1 Tax=Parasponia andersonii TaxID=3476 RepID=A0A2P5DY29_PARAD|nr:hypothetical protein PanWU01x14_021480 [Parasponia andersonii]